jgi:peptidyl-prolyl cis-trans isomerase B (cyclophilin B)
VPGKDRQRALARAKLERQMARRAAAARRRRQLQAGLGAAVAVVVLVAGVWYLVAQLHGDTPAKTTAAASGCAYPKSPEAASKDVGVPTVDNVPRAGTQTVTMKTNVGTVTADLDLAHAPCTAHSFAHLASQKYFDGTSCHRLLDSNGGFVLQCGDPTGTGTGGPGYQFGTENLPTGKNPAYPAGTLAMARSQDPNSNGSQFFIVYRDSTAFSPDYTVFGHVTSGLDVVQKAAATGVQPGTDKPKEKVTFSSVTVEPPRS